MRAKIVGFPGKNAISFKNKTGSCVKSRLPQRKFPASSRTLEKFNYKLGLAAPLRISPCTVSQKLLLLASLRAKPIWKKKWWFGRGPTLQCRWSLRVRSLSKYGLMDFFHNMPIKLLLSLKSLKNFFLGKTGFFLTLKFLSHPKIRRWNKRFQKVEWTPQKRSLQCKKSEKRGYLKWSWRENGISCKVMELD